MTTRRSTKSALLSSVVSLFLCFTMLLGTTFAWFTDSASSANNIITSGNLDVELWHCPPYNTQWGFGYDETNGTEITGDTDLFLNIDGDPILWEPGAGASETFRVKNAGNLALKFQFKIKTTSATTTPDGKALTDILRLQIIELENDADNVPVAVTNGVNYTGTFGNGYIISGELLPEETADFNVAIDWIPSADDNDYNVEDGLEIVFNVDLLATQLSHENDSFDNTYDENAWMEGMAVVNESTLKAAIAAGGDVILGADITLSETLTIPENTSVNLDLNGKTLSGTGEKQVDVLVNNGTLSIKGGTVSSLGNDGGSAIRNFGTLIVNDAVINGAPYTALDGWWPSYAINNSGSMTITDSTINSEHGAISTNANGTTVINNIDVSMGKVGSTSHAIYTNGNGTAIINGGNFENTAADQNATGASVINGAITVLSGNFSGRVENYFGTPVIKGGTFSSNPSSFVAADFKVITADDGLFYVVPDSITPDNVMITADDLVALSGTTVNGTYYLAADIDMTGKTMKSMIIASAGTVEFIGNDHSISNLTLATPGAHGMTGADNESAGLFDISENSGCALTVSDLTLNNVNIECDGYAAAIVGYANNANDVITLNNVDVHGATISSDSVAAFVAYTTGTVALTDCDVSELALTGEAGRPEKVGAYIGTLNTSTGAATVTNCTNATSYSPAGRVINGAKMTLDGMAYVTTSAALKAAVANGSASIYLAPAASAYTISDIAFGGKTVTIKGSKDAVINANISVNNQFVTGATLVFDGVTVNFGTDGYLGLANTASLTYRNCVINGYQYLYGNSITFDHCVINSTGYSACVYDADNVTFTECEFNTAGKALLLYKDDLVNKTYNVTVEKCTFNASAPAYASAISNQSCAAIELHNYGASYNLTSSENTIDDDFSGEWRIKVFEASKGTTVTVNGTAYTQTAVDGTLITVVNKEVQ